MDNLEIIQTSGFQPQDQDVTIILKQSYIDDSRRWTETRGFSI